MARAWESSEEYARDGWEPWPFLPSGEEEQEEPHSEQRRRRGEGEEEVSGKQAVDAAEEVDVKADPAHWRTFLPHTHGTDGFFISRWRRDGAVWKGRGVRDR